MKERRYDIDWVRVVATLVVFVFHSGRFFDKLDWHLKNTQQSYFLTNYNHKVLTYSNEAVLPFYIFHQTIILCVGWFILRWNIGIGQKYLIIALISFVLIMALYDLLVRRFNVMRFFFGMRPKKKL